jgi:hypothetical protein
MGCHVNDVTDESQTAHGLPQSVTESVMAVRQSAPLFQPLRQLGVNSCLTLGAVSALRSRARAERENWRHSGASTGRYLPCRYDQCRYVEP